MTTEPLNTNLVFSKDDLKQFFPSQYQTHKDRYGSLPVDDLEEKNTQKVQKNANKNILEKDPNKNAEEKEEEKEKGGYEERNAYSDLQIFSADTPKSSSKEDYNANVRRRLIRQGGKSDLRSADDLSIYFPRPSLQMSGSDLEQLQQESPKSDLLVNFGGLEIESSLSLKTPKLEEPFKLTYKDFHISETPSAIEYFETIHPLDEKLSTEIARYLIPITPSAVDLSSTVTSNSSLQSYTAPHNSFELSSFNQSRLSYSAPDFSSAFIKTGYSLVKGKQSSSHNSLLTDDDEVNCQNDQIQDKNQKELIPDNEDLLSNENNVESNVENKIAEKNENKIAEKNENKIAEKNETDEKVEVEKKEKRGGLKEETTWGRITFKSKSTNDLKIGDRRPPKKSEYSWNDEFQEIITRTETSKRSHLQNLHDITDLRERFQKIAQENGRKIIEMDKKERYFHCLKGKGVAGGEKFIFDNIFFKFATDDKGIYGGEAYAQKAAGHEIRSMVELVNLQIPRLHLPLTCVIDYLGYRLLAMGILPIEANTLVFGSSDGGKNFIQSSDEAYRLTRDIAIHLNLKPHHFGKHLIYTPVDMEIHKTKDGRLYIIDAARLWPPTYDPEVKKSSAFLYNLMRPEFLRKYPKPLSSDALSGFSTSKDDEQFHIHNTEVGIASLFLKTALSKRCAYSLLDNWEQVKKSHNSLVAQIHRNGINLRYMKRLLFYLSEIEGTKSFELRRAIIIEIIGRSIKGIIREAWRKQPIEGAKTQCKKVLYKILKDLYEGDKTILEELKKQIDQHFHLDLDEVSFLIKPSFSKIFRRLQKILSFCEVISLRASEMGTDLNIRNNFDFEDEEDFLNQIELLPKIKNFPFHSHHDLLSVFNVQGENGLAQVRLQLITQINERSITVDPSFHYTLLPLYQSLAQCTFLLLKGQNLLSEEDYKIGFRYFNESIFALDQCHEINTSLNKIEKASENLFEKIDRFYEVSKRRTEALVSGQNADNLVWALGAAISFYRALNFHQKHQLNENIFSIAKATLKVGEIIPFSGSQTSLIVFALDTFKTIFQTENHYLIYTCYDLLSKVGQSSKVQSFARRKLKEISAKLELDEHLDNASLQIIQALEKLGSHKTSQIATEYLSLAKIYIQKMEWEKSISSVQKARRIFLKIYGNNRFHIELGRCDFIHAQIYWNQSDFQKAGQYLNHAFEAFSQHHNAHSLVDYADCLYLMTRLFSRTNDPKFKEFFQQASNCFSQQKKKGGDILMENLSNRNNLYQAIFQIEKERKKSSFIPHHLIEVKQRLKRGTYGPTFLALYQTEPRLLYRIKTFSYSSGTFQYLGSGDVTTGTAFINELNYDLKHPNIRQILGYSIFEEEINLLSKGEVRSDFAYLLLESYGTSLYSRMKDENELQTLLGEKYSIILQLANALDFIHSKKIVHFNISCRNVLINIEGKVKLFDFGNSSTLSEKSKIVPYALSPFYGPPEISEFFQQLEKESLFSQKGIVSQKSFCQNHPHFQKISWSNYDIFSFGVLIFELITGQTLERKFKINSDVSTFQRQKQRVLKVRNFIESGQLIHEVKQLPEEKCSHSFKQELLLCLHPQNNNRISSKQFLTFLTTNRNPFIPANQRNSIPVQEISELSQNVEQEEKKKKEEKLQLKRSTNRKSLPAYNLYSKSDLKFSTTHKTDIFRNIKYKLGSSFLLLDPISERTSLNLSGTMKEILSNFISESKILFFICRYEHHLPILNWYLHQKANLNSIFPSSKNEFHFFSGLSLVHIASQYGNLKILKSLKNSNVSLNVSSEIFSETPLHIAVVAGHEDIVDFLLGAKVDLNKEDYTGSSPLELAFLYKKEKIFHKLLEAGADVNKVDQQGVPLLQKALNHPEDEVYVTALTNVGATLVSTKKIDLKGERNASLTTLELFRQSRTGSLEERNHIWKIYSFKTPTECFICHKFLWGLVQQGTRCEICEMPCHKACYRTASECSKKQGGYRKQK